MYVWIPPYLPVFKFTDIPYSKVINDKNGQMVSDVLLYWSVDQLTHHFGFIEVLRVYL